jgi:Tol biopolymer transport system component
MDSRLRRQTLSEFAVSLPLLPVILSMRPSQNSITRLFPLVITALMAITGYSAGQTTRISVDSAGLEGNDTSTVPDVSWDGRHVVFQSRADLAPEFHLNGAHYNIYVHDRALGTTVTLDHAEFGGASWGSSQRPSISANGRWVSYFSTAVLTSHPGSGIYLYDRDPDENGVYDEGNGFNTLISLRMNGDAAAWLGVETRISGNGRWITYHSLDSDIVVGDTNGFTDVFLYDRVTGQTVRGSLGPGGVEGDADSWAADLSYDGRCLVFVSGADSFAPHQANRDLYFRDRDPDGNGIFDEGNAIIELVSQSTAGVFGNHDSDRARISGDGNRIIFQSVATTLVTGFIYSDVRIFLREISSGTTLLASVDSFGNSASTHSYNADISPDGRYVSFHSDSYNLVAGDVNGVQDVFLHDLSTGLTSLVSYGPAGLWGDKRSDYSALPVGATSVIFASEATNFVPNDTNNRADIFALDGVNGSSLWLHAGPMRRNTQAQVDAYGFEAGERVFLLRGLGGIGVGQCPPELGGLCIDLLDPVVIQMSAPADSFGHVSYSELIPTSTPLIEIYFQAVAARGLNGIDSVKSTAVSAEILP